MEERDYCGLGWGIRLMSEWNMHDALSEGKHILMVVLFSITLLLKKARLFSSCCTLIGILLLVILIFTTYGVKLLLVCAGHTRPINTSNKKSIAVLT